MLAVSSLAVALGANAWAATRPRYGGVLHAETRGEKISSLRGLVYENLVVMDDFGRPQPNLATAWESQSGSRRWQFHIRTGLKFHDGTPLTPSTVVQSLAAVGCNTCPWTVRAVGDSVVFESNIAVPWLPAALALPRWSIVHKAVEGPLAGTGPFHIAAIQGGRTLLDANNDYWRGRPYLDSIEPQFGRALRDQLTDFTLGHTDLIEVGPDQIRRLQDDRARTYVSQPIELVAIVVNQQNVPDARLREAVSVVMDRGAINNVLLQRRGEAAGGLLPNWISGYAFLFPTTQDLRRARELQAQAQGRKSLVIAYPENDWLLQLMAERVAVNARDAGIPMQTSSDASSADMELRYLAINSTDPAVGLAEILRNFTNDNPGSLDTPEARYAKEREFLQSYAVIPIVHLPRAYAFAPRLHNWSPAPSGDARLDELWMEPEEQKQ